MKHLLIIEDDPAIAGGLSAALTVEQYQVTIEDDGEKGFRAAQKPGVDLILLDINLPSKNGKEICRDLRAASINTPIIMLTSNNEEIDKLIGFELGADDYITKPFSVRELQARIKALLRRKTEAPTDIEEYEFGNVQVNFKKMAGTRGKESITLSAKEFEILKYFVLHESEVVTRDMLLNDVWGYDHFPTTRTVDNYVLALRKKIEDDPSKPVHLITMHSAGYKFVR